MSTRMKTRLLLFALAAAACAVGGTLVLGLAEGSFGGRVSVSHATSPQGYWALAGLLGATLAGLCAGAWFLVDGIRREGALDAFLLERERRRAAGRSRQA